MRIAERLRMRTTPLLGLGALALALAAGCDPCSGVGSCGGPRVRYEGRVLIEYPAAPAESTRVEFVRTGGVRLQSETLTASTDSAGRFELEGGAEENGQVVGDLVIYPVAPTPPVRISGVQLATTRTPGELRVLGEWKIPHPYLGVSGVVFYRSDGRPAQRIPVEFRRTGGITTDPQIYQDTTDESGRFEIKPRVGAAGTVVGDLVVHPLPPGQPYQISGLKLTTFLTQRPDTVIRVGLGSYLPYYLILVWQDTGEGVDGAQVEFRRTSGPPIYPVVFTNKSDRFGTVFINPVPLLDGEVHGDLVVRPPAPGRTFTIPDLRLQTVVDERAPVGLGFFGVPRGAPAP
jgi:hypothetical protein